MTNTSCLNCGNAPSFAPSFEGYVRCTDCGMLINSPFPSQAEIEEYYRSRTSTGNYQLLPEHDILRKEGYRGLLRQLVKQTGCALAGAPIIDIGCLNGASLEVISEFGGDPYGIELQEEAAGVAAAKFPQHVITGDVCTSSLFDRQFSVVIMKDVVEHLSDPRGALSIVQQHLCENGHLVLTTPDTSSLAARLLRGNWPSLSPVHHIYLFNKNNLKTLLQSCGFEVVSVKPLWKGVSLRYVKWIMPNFNKQLARILNIIPDFLLDPVLPLNGGEVQVIARKAAAS